MTFFLDGPPPPTRSADKIPSKAPVATPVSGARQAPEPSGLTGIPVAPKKPAPTAERQRRNTRMAALRASAMRVAERQEREIEEAATAAPASPTATTPTSTAIAAPEEPATVEATSTATTTATTTAAPAAAEEESEMRKPNKNSGAERMLEAMRAEPKRSWRAVDLVEIYGSDNQDVIRNSLRRWVSGGAVKQVARGAYKWAGEQEEQAPPKAMKPGKKKPARQPVEEPEEDDDHTVVADGFGNDEDDEEVSPPPSAPGPADAPPTPPAFFDRVEALPASGGRPARLRILHVEIEGDISDATMRAALDELHRALARG